MDSPNSMRNNTYLPTLQANCATISHMRKHTTPTRPDYFPFLRQIQARVLTKSQQAIYLKTKTNDHVGNGSLSLLLCLESVESVCMMWKTLPINLFWIVLMWRPAFGSQVTSRNRDPFSKEKREPWERGCFARLADRWICQVFKRSILFYRSDTTRSFRPVLLWLRKPFLAELVILLIRCIQKHEFNIRVLLLIASQFRHYFFRILYFTSYLY